MPDGKKVKRLRAEKGWTQEELWKKVGCSKRSIENIEAGKPVLISTMREVATALGLEPRVLLAPETEQPQAIIRELSPVCGGSAPPLPSLLIGRDAALGELKSRLTTKRVGSATGDARLQVLTAVHGWPGVGKTTLAAALAHDSDLAAAFNDGVLWASLGQEPDVLFELAAWGRAVGIDAPIRAKSIAEASGELTAALRSKRMLLIVDDVWDIHHALPFRVGGSQCAMLVTTRLTSLADELAPTSGDVYRLDVLSESDALDLLRALAPAVVKQHPAECRRLIRELEGLPLALQVAGRLLNAEAGRGWGVRELLWELKEDATRLLQANAPADMADLLQQTSPTVAALLHKSTDRLDSESRERFAILAPFAPKPAIFELKDIAAMWNVDDPKPTVRLLVDRGLLEPAGSARFRMHALLVAHARSLCTE